MDLSSLLGLGQTALELGLTYALVVLALAGYFFVVR